MYTTTVTLKGGDILEHADADAKHVQQISFTCLAQVTHFIITVVDNIVDISPAHSQTYIVCIIGR